MTAIDILLATLFAAIAFVYASVGLGGGSAYTALLIIANLPTAAIPTISLTLNLIVTGAGSYQFIRNGHAKLKLILPFLLSSVPMSYLGGTLQLDKTHFQVLLLVSLVALLPLLLAPKPTGPSLRPHRLPATLIALLCGSLLGFLAGAAGIGGGIYLVPLIIVLGLGNSQQAAAAGAVFILCNSIAGLAARAQYHELPWEQLGLFGVAVLIGGGTGARLGAQRFAATTLEKILSLIILSAIVLLAYRLLYGE